jgi:transposase-like protein
MGRKGYSAEFRRRAVSLAEEIGDARAASILGVTTVAIWYWKKLPLDGKAMKKDLSPELKAALLEADQARKEAKRLRLENEELKTANLILKEIAQVFSKDHPDSSSGWSLNSRKEK